MPQSRTINEPSQHDQKQLHEQLSTYKKKGHFCHNSHVICVITLLLCEEKTNPYGLYEQFTGSLLVTVLLITEDETCMFQSHRETNQVMGSLMEIKVSDKCRSWNSLEIDFVNYLFYHSVTEEMKQPH